MYILVDEVGDLEFSSWRERELLKVSENLVVELVIPDIGETSETGIGWLFDDSRCLSTRVYCENPEVARISNLLAECSVSTRVCELHDIRGFIEVIS